MYALYRKISPYLKTFAINLGISSGTCRYTPACSLYSKQAYEKYGFLWGSWLSMQRLLKCHPWSKGGYDPVPIKRDRN